MPDTKYPLKVFLCHAHSDRSSVRTLYSRLKREGVDVWLDKEKLLPGSDWELEIRKAVREADVVVVCLSKQFNQAGFRQKEVRIAIDTAMEKPEGEIFIIPARLEECENLKSLSKWHWVDLFEDDGYSSLIRALRVRANSIGATIWESQNLEKEEPEAAEKFAREKEDREAREKAAQEKLELEHEAAEKVLREKKNVTPPQQYVVKNPPEIFNRLPPHENEPSRKIPQIQKPKVQSSQRQSGVHTIFWIIGVITLKAPVYKSIAEDATLTGQAAIIVAIAMLIQGFFQGLIVPGADGTTVSINVVGGIISAIVLLVLGLLAWVASAWILAFVANALGGKTDTGEMLRVTGFVQVFNLVAVLNIAAVISTALLCVTGLIGLVVGILSLVGYFIGVREAAEFSNGKAFLTALIAAVVKFVIVAGVGSVIIAAIVAATVIAG